MLRRLLSVALLIACQNLYLYVKLVLFIAIHFTVMLYTIIIRPLEEVKDNMIEIINEIGYTLLICTLLYYNKQSRWSEKDANIIIYSLLSLSVVTTLISSTALVITLYKKCIKCCNRKTKVNRVIDETTINDNEPKTINVTNSSVSMRSQNRSVGYDNSEVSSHHISPNVRDNRPAKMVKKGQQIAEVPIYDRFEKIQKDFYRRND